MSSKTLLCTVAAMILTACTPPTEPGSGNEPRAALAGYSADTVLAFTSNVVGYHQIYTVNADGSGMRRLTYNGDWDGFPSFNGNRIAFAHLDSSVSSSIEIMNIDGGGVTALEVAPTGYQDDEPSWGPALYSAWGNQIAFTRFNGYWNGSNIYKILGSATTGLWNGVRLTNTGLDSKPAWKPDGSKIAFLSRRDQGRGCRQGIYLMNPDGTAQARVSPCNMEADELAWKPDGSRIAAVDGSSNKFLSDLYTLDPVSGKFEHGAFLEPAGGGLSWYPDGSKIAVALIGARIDTVNVQTGHEGRLFPADASHPSWGVVAARVSPF